MHQWMDVADARWRYRQVMSERAGESRRLPTSAWVFDSVLALVAAGLATAILVPMVPVPVARAVPGGVLALGYGLVLLHTLPLAVRRRFPGTVLTLILASGLAFAAFSCRRSSSGRRSWWPSIRWRPTAAGGSR